MWFAPITFPLRVSENPVFSLPVWNRVQRKPSPESPFLLVVLMLLQLSGPDLAERSHRMPVFIFPFYFITVLRLVRIELFFIFPANRATLFRTHF